MLAKLVRNSDSETQKKFYRCRRCETVYDEVILDARDNQCLCGCRSFTIVEATTPTDVSKKPWVRPDSSSRGLPHERSFVEDHEEGSLIKHEVIPSKIPWKLLFSVFLFAVLGVILLFGIDAALENASHIATDMGALSTIEPLSPVEPTAIPQIFIEGMQETEAQGPVILRYFWSDDVSLNEQKTLFAVAFLCIILLVGFLDRKRSHQNSDAVIAVIVILLYFVMGMAVFQQIIINLQPIWAVITLWAVTLGLFGLLCGAVVSGAFDLTPVIMVLSVLAIGGGTLINNLGAVQTLSGISSDHLYTFGSMVKLSKIHMMNTMGAFTMLTYALFLAAILCSFIEIIRPTRSGVRMRVQNFYGFFLSLGVVGLFVLLRSISIPPDKWYSFLSNPLILMLLFIVGDFIFANIKREEMDGYGVSYTEYVLENLRIASPYDLILFQVVLGSFLMVLLGKI